MFALNLSAVFVIQFYGEDVKFALERADFVFCNEDEADAWGKANGMEGASREDIAKALASIPKVSTKRPRCAIVTQGSHPVILSTLNAEGNATVETIELEKIDKSTIVDTNGAGDSFVGAFFAAFIQGKSIPDCIRAGNHLAGIVITKSGCQFE